MTENGLMDGTRTEKLFYNDSHLSKFTAMVLECEPYEKKEGCYAVELDRTAFFPEGGGQYADTGKLKDAKVSDVREKNGRILHITDQPFEAGEIVEGEIDWETRFMKMQQHTGEHIVSGIVHARYGFNNVGFHLGTEDCTMDFDGEISKEALQEIELEANRAVWKNLTIEVSYPSKEELEELERAVKEFEEAMKEDDLGVLAAADVKVHEVIYGSTHNKRLVQIISNIREQMYRYRVEYLKDVESRKTLVEEHYAVYRALKARNQQQAVKDICIHIVNQQNAILRSLEQMNKEEQEK